MTQFSSFIFTKDGNLTQQNLFSLFVLKTAIDLYILILFWICVGCIQSTRNEWTNSERQEKKKLLRKTRKTNEQPYRFFQLADGRILQKYGIRGGIINLLFFHMIQSLCGTAHNFSVKIWKIKSFFVSDAVVFW
jgi:hypothetical protein